MVYRYFNVNSKLNQPLISFERIENFVQIEPALLIFCLALTAWITSRTFLKHLTEERQRNHRNLLRNLGGHLLTGSVLFISYSILHQLSPALSPAHSAQERLMTYIGLATIFLGALVFIKVCRILVLQYLFLSHRRVAFPVLLVNLFTLLLSLGLATWIGAEIFGIRLTPILATSAIFSLVLGLALQDTLGNLFAGITLQFDKPYEIGDWIEIQTGTQKWVGQVIEISWRATIMISFTDETITVPNRVVAQAQIANYSTKFRPIIRSQTFRLPFGSSIESIKTLLLKSIETIEEIRKIPAPTVRVAETTESWVEYRLIYFIDDFGNQYRIADQVLTFCVQSLEKAQIPLAGYQFHLNS
jgi:small-conductance mechanosensitive channel